MSSSAANISSSVSVAANANCINDNSNNGRNYSDSSNNNHNNNNSCSSNSDSNMSQKVGRRFFPLFVSFLPLLHHSKGRVVDTSITSTYVCTYVRVCETHTRCGW